MSTELLTVLGLLAAAIVMFAINRPRMDAVALIMLTVMPLLGIISVNEALAGFADPNVVLIAALFVLGDGLVRTGVTRRLGDWLMARAGASEAKLIVLLMIVVAGLSSVMSSTAVTAIFIPVALRVAQKMGTSPGRLMMPLSFAALMSGMLTLVATPPNLVVNAELERQGREGFTFFSFTPFGAPILLLGIAYMLVARRWLPKGEGASAGRRRRSLADWIQEYGLAGRAHRLRLHASSDFVGRTLDELALRRSERINVVAVERGSRFAREILQPAGSLRLMAGDALLVDVMADRSDIAALAERHGLEALPLTNSDLGDRAQDIGMAEVIVPDGSDLVDHTLIERAFRTRTGVTVIGMRRGTKASAECPVDVKLRIGDTLLVVGPWNRMDRLHPDESGVLLLRLPDEAHDVLPAPGRAPFAVACLLLTLALMITGAVPNVMAALVGCLLLGVFGCVTLSSAYRSIDWKTIVLIVGMLPFSTALERTGGVELGANALHAATATMGPSGILAGVFAMTVVLSLFISNTATALLMAPVAIAIADGLEASPAPFAMIVALAASTAFMTPVSSPVNTLVVSPGNYRFFDFVKVGVPFSIIVLIVSVLLVPRLLPFERPMPPALPPDTVVEPAPR